MLRRLSTMLTSYHLYLDGISAIPQHATARFFCDLPLLTSVDLEQGGYMIALLLQNPKTKGKSRQLAYELLKTT